MALGAAAKGGPAKGAMLSGGLVGLASSGMIAQSALSVGTRQAYRDCTLWKELEVHEHGVTCLQASGSMFATADEGGELVLWDMAIDFASHVLRRARPHVSDSVGKMGPRFFAVD